MGKIFKKNFVTKAEIIKAILTEPVLCPGHWAGMADGTETSEVAAKTRNSACRVCAIGSIFRRTMLPGKALNVVITTAQNTVRYGRYSYISSVIPISTRKKFLVDAKLWLSLLSCEFEERFDYVAFGEGPIVRKAFAQWVKENFPNRVSLKPEEGVLRG